MSREELEARVRADHAAVVGKLIRVRCVTGHPKGQDASEDYVLDPPALCRVLPAARPGYLHHWIDEWLDPYWDLELVELHPQLAECEPWLYMFGPSYNLKTGQRQDDAVWELAKTQGEAQ